MLNCNFTGNTVHDFFSNCTNNDSQINVIGAYPQNKIERVLQCSTTPTSTETDTWVQFFIPEIVDIPVQKPDIESIASVHSCIEIISQRVIKTPTVTGYTPTGGTPILGENILNSECTRLTGKKLIIEGLIKQKVIYTANVDTQSVHSASFTVPFSVFIIVDTDTPLSQEFKIYPYIEDIFAAQLSNRSVFKNTTIFIKASKIC